MVICDCSNVVLDAHVSVVSVRVGVGKSGAVGVTGGSSAVCARPSLLILLFEIWFEGGLGRLIKNPLLALALGFVLELLPVEAHVFELLVDGRDLLFTQSVSFAVHYVFDYDYLVDQVVVVVKPVYTYLVHVLLREVAVQVVALLLGWLEVQDGAEHLEKVLLDVVGVEIFARSHHDVVVLVLEQSLHLSEAILRVIEVWLL